MNDQGNGLKQDAIFGVGVLDLFRLGRLLGFVENRFQALVQPAAHTRILWRGVVLQEPQQLDRQPGRGHEVVGVVLEVGVARSDNLLEEKFV